MAGWLAQILGQASLAGRVERPAELSVRIGQKKMGFPRIRLDLSCFFQVVQGAERIAL